MKLFCLYFKNLVRIDVVLFLVYLACVGFMELLHIENCVCFMVVICHPHLRSSGVLQSHSSVLRVFSKIFILLLSNRKFEMELLSGAFEKCCFPS